MRGPQRQCLTCKRIGPWGRDGRCTSCSIDRARQREADPRRRAIKGDRYDSAHRTLRRYWDRVVRLGAVDCARCQQPIPPGAPWDLDHLPDGTSQPSHAACNRAAITRPA